MYVTTSKCSSYENNGVTTTAENASQTNNAWSSLSIQHNNDGAIKVRLEKKLFNISP